MWRARIVEVGFALPPSTTEHTVTSDGKWRLQSVAGLDRQLQYFIVRVGSEADTMTRDVLVVCAHHPPLSDEAIAPNVTAMAAQYSAHIPAWIRQDRPGWARLICSDVDAGELAAAAVAVVKASGGWDESNPILVETDTQRFEVTAQYVDKDWRAQVRRADLRDK